MRISRSVARCFLPTTKALWPHAPRSPCHRTAQRPDPTVTSLGTRTVQGGDLPTCEMHHDARAKPSWDSRAPLWSQVPKLSPSKPAIGTPMGRAQAQQPVPRGFWPPKYTPLAGALLPSMVLEAAHRITSLYHRNKWPQLC